MRDPETGGSREKSRSSWQSDAGARKSRREFWIHFIFFFFFFFKLTEWQVSEGRIFGVSTCSGLLAAAAQLGHNCFRMSPIAREGAAARDQLYRGINKSLECLTLKVFDKLKKKQGCTSNGINSFSFLSARQKPFVVFFNSSGICECHNANNSCQVFHTAG